MNGNGICDLVTAAAFGEWEAREEYAEVYEALVDSERTRIVADGDAMHDVMESVCSDYPERVEALLIALYRAKMLDSKATWHGPLLKTMIDAEIDRRAARAANL